MAKRKKSKRRLPPHIVMPNGMWRFVKRGSKKARTHKAYTSHTKRKRRATMARKYRRRTVRRSTGSIMKGFYHPKGIIASMLLGVAAGEVAKKILPNMPLAQPLAAGVVGGAPGVGGQILLNTFGGSVGGTLQGAFASVWN